MFYLTAILRFLPEEIFLLQVNPFIGNPNMFGKSFFYYYMGNAELRAIRGTPKELFISPYQQLIAPPNS